MRNFIFYYYIVINGLSFFICSLDKLKAVKKGWRIKERTLHILSFIGGVFGNILSMIVFKHKINKIKFKAVSLTALILHITAIVYFFVNY